MSWKSEGHRYGAVAVAMHWVSAAAILGLLGSGLAMVNITDEGVRQSLLRTHAIFGIFVFSLTLLRLAWWAFADRKPMEAPGTPRWQSTAAWAVHRLFYVVIVVMGASGIAMLALSGVVPMLLAGQAGTLPDFHQFAPRAAHGLGAWLMMALIALHVAAAFFHQFVRGDRLLGRMGLGRAR